MTEISIVSWQKASAVLHSVHCIPSYTRIHHPLLHGPSDHQWTSEVELVHTQMMFVCPLASRRLRCLEEATLSYLYLSGLLPLSALMPKAAHRVGLVGCSLPFLLKLSPPLYLSHLFTDGCVSQTTALAKTKDGCLETVEVRGSW